MRFPVIACILLALAAPRLSAQVVSGRVSDTSGRPIRFATVMLLDAQGMTVGHSQADGDGRYAVRLQGTGRYRLRAEASGYRPQVSRLANLAQGREVRRNFTLRAVRTPPGPEGGVGRPFPGPVPAPTPAVPPVPPGPRVP